MIKQKANYWPCFSGRNKKNTVMLDWHSELPLLPFRFPSLRTAEQKKWLAKKKVTQFSKKKTWFTVISAIFDAELDFSQRNGFLAFCKHYNGRPNTQSVELFSLFLLMYGFDIVSYKPPYVVWLLFCLYIFSIFVKSAVQRWGVCMLYHEYIF